MPADPIKLSLAVRDFQAAHHSAAIQGVMARLRGRSNDLLSYEEVARMLRLRGSSDAGTHPIPVRSIVGSVSRYTDFTRTFLPRHAEDQERWSRVKTAFMAGDGLPPIEVYRVGEAYFVLDGNHRVSIARQEGMEFIDAHVIDVRTDVPLTPDMKPDDLIIKAEYAEFLEQTGIMGLRPNVDLSVTVPGQYRKLLEQIYGCEYVCEQEAPGERSFERGIQQWYDGAYTPLVEAIRDRGLLRSFPGRTLTDLYVWITENRKALAEQYGWEIQSDAAAADLILKRGARQKAGAWRKARTVARYSDRLFADILVPLTGDPRDWDPLDQAIQIAACEGSVLHGLHVAPSPEDCTSAGTQALQEEFARRCEENGVKGRLVVETGSITERVRERLAIADLVVLKLINPPPPGLAGFQSPFRAVIANSPRPVLALPAKPTRFQRAVLAYDGSPLSREALFVAAYLAEMWKTELLVFTCLDGGPAGPDPHDYVRRYLDIHEVAATYVVSDRGPAASLKRAIRELEADLLLLGSYNGPAIREIVAGSFLDRALREVRVPIFICR